MAFLSHTQFQFLKEKHRKLLQKMQAILVIVTEQPFLTFCSLFNGGFWFFFFLKLQLCCNPLVLPMLLIAPMVCAPLCCCTYIWSKKLLFLCQPPQFTSEGVNLGLAGSLHVSLLINTLRPFCFQQQKKENHL